MDNAKKLAHDKRMYLEDWLEDAKSIQIIVPKVQRQLELAVWDEKALSDIPRGLESTVSKDVRPMLEQDLQTLHEALPKPARVDLDKLYISDVTTSTTSTTIYHFASDARQNGDSQIQMWGSQHCEQYETLQSELGREKEVRSLLHNLRTNLGLEFDEAASAYSMARAGTGTQRNAGIAMRNVLEHYKGELMARACHVNEQKVTWQQMADRLVRDQGTPRGRFMEQESTWGRLHRRLTGLAKNREQLDHAAVASIFTEFLDHLYIVLSLAK